MTTENNKLYMIGNSHIDPVWFWDWDEGMQEVKSTFASALDRMKEHEEMTFTVTSTAFLEWILQIAPSMFEEIKKRVAEGRFLLTGGWFIEPDCILPCGEAFVRQGLYGQRFLEEHFGIKARTGSNADSFGHHPVLPQILKKSGIEEYVFMRPRLETPLFMWESADGSRVMALSLPSEYTTWFYESAKEAVQMALAAADRAGLHGMACCYGVGNHGGGPTKKNLEAIQKLQIETKDAALLFSGYHDFFDELTESEKAALPVRKEFFDKMNTGCYSMDSELKKMNRLAENRLLNADFMLALEKTAGNVANSVEETAGRLRTYWKKLLFNQFHDTLGGTAVKSARNEAVMQLAAIASGCKEIITISMQNIVNHCDTRGEGFPIFLFNPTGRAYTGPVEMELNWFCKDGLRLLNHRGEEIPYQRTYTEAKARNYNLGGRRAVAFYAHIPAAGYTAYRSVIGEPTCACDVRVNPEFSLADNHGCLRNDDPFVLENNKIKAVFNEDGFLCSLLDKENEYEALNGPVRFPIWLDERDTWGSRQERRFEESGACMEAVGLTLVESGSIRKVVRAEYRHGASRICQHYILWKNAAELEVRTKLFWDKEWKMLYFALPLFAADSILSECAYGTWERTPQDAQEYSMHRFIDVHDTADMGLYAANDCKYMYVKRGMELHLGLARSAIFAQGYGKDWYNEIEGHSYADQGEQEFTFLFKPHGRKLSADMRYRLAEMAQRRILYLADSQHGRYAAEWDEKSGCSFFGKSSRNSFSLVECSSRNIEIAALKQAEDGSGQLILRLLETEGIDSNAELTVNGHSVSFSIGHYEIKTLKVNLLTGEFAVTDLLEYALPQ